MCSFEGQYYKSDVGRLIRKFDIYICDLGEIDATRNNLNKTRPCVIISSDDYINPKSNAYVVAPIRTEHKADFEQIGIEEFIKDKRKVGRIYVPIEMAEDDVRFIGITEIRKLDSRDVIKYSSSILNNELKKRINKCIVDYLFSSFELRELLDNDKSETKIVTKKECKEMEESEVKEATIPIESNPIYKEEETKKVVTIPVGFSLIHKKVKSGKLTVVEAADKLGMKINDFMDVLNIYESMPEFKKNEPTDKKRRSKIELPPDFNTIYDEWKIGELSTGDACILLDISKTNYSRFYRMVKIYEEVIKY